MLMILGAKTKRLRSVIVIADVFLCTYLLYRKLLFKKM